jgi:hypothetical protein
MLILAIKCFPSGLTRIVINQHKKPTRKGEDIPCRIGKRLISQQEANRFLCKLRNATQGTV